MSRAFEILNLPEASTPDEIKLRWRELCSIHHPDRGGDAAKFDEFRKAYEAAMKEANQLKPCNACAGSGKVNQTHGWTSIKLPCPDCGGGGVIHPHKVSSISRVR